MEKLLVIDRLRFFNDRALNSRGHIWMDLPLPQEFSTYFPIVLSLDSMMTGPDDYDTPSNTIYCPCGEEIHWPSGIVGDAVRLSTAHLTEAHGK